MPKSALSSEAEPWHARLNKLIDRVENKLKPDVILIDARAGISEYSAAAITHLHGDLILLFALDEQQTWNGYKELFTYWRHHGMFGNGEHEVDIRDKLQLVGALIPELQRQPYTQGLLQKAYDLFRLEAYNKPEENEGTDIVREDDEDPHFPIPILWTQSASALKEMWKDTENLDPNTVTYAFGEFIKRITKTYIVMTHPQEIRELLLSTLPKKDGLDEHAPPESIFFPRSHIKALSRERSLILGERGTGKSFCTKVIGDSTLRYNLLARTENRNHDSEWLGRTHAVIAFSHQHNDSVYPNSLELKKLLHSAAPEHIWLAVMARWLSKNMLGTPENTYTSWEHIVHWVRDHPDQCAALLQKADNKSVEHDMYVLFLFDAMDRTADAWESMNALLKAALRISLYVTGFQRLSCKIFARSDQCAKVKDFPDYSKISINSITLDWSREDLNEMIWGYLKNNNIGRNIFDEHFHKIGIGKLFSHLDWERRDKFYRDLFYQLAGDRMGKDARRGNPYTWIINHLADGNGKTSPRSFITSLRKAAELTSEKHPDCDYALHYECIKESVIEASKVRSDEIEEDYPWVKHFLMCLKGKNVPLQLNEIGEVWTKKFPNGAEEFLRSEGVVPPLNLHCGLYGVFEELCHIGVFEKRDETTVDVPDLYRMAYGMLRRGGVKAKKKQA